MSEKKIVWLNANGPDGIGLKFRGNHENKNVTAGNPVEIGAPWEAESGCLFTSDMLYDGPHGLAWPPNDPILYAESLRRFRALPVTVIHGGHYGSFDRTGCSSSSTSS